jgi:mRNA interferase MazF
MREGEIVLAVLPQVDREQKPRPVLILRKMPNGDFLVCAISTQMNKYIPEFDEIIRAEDREFAATGLKKESLVRLSFLHVLPLNELRRSIGCVSDLTYQKLLLNLSRHINLPLENNETVTTKNDF